ncbi:MAG: MBL fold metallo-hydrolase [Mangrovicoccus sp.]|nr:MBL fold metallo-hydrolase [Mangrovicoccus sp.]
MDGTGKAKGQIDYPFPEPPEDGGAVEIAPGLLWMRLPLPMALNHVNIYALEDGDGWTIIDTGLGTKTTREMWERLLAGPLAGRPVRRVIVTHHHLDHIGQAGWFQSEHGAELLTTRTAWLFARMLLLDVQERPTEEMIAYWQGAGMDPAILEERRNSRPLNYADAVSPMPLGYKRIKEGDVLRIGARDWRVRIGNGHAPEHATLWCEEDGLILAGDQLLSRISPNIGVYATEPEADPMGEWLESCTELGKYARQDHLVLPGHQLPFTGVSQRLEDLIRGHVRDLDRLEEFLKTPHSATECFKVLYRRPIEGMEYGLALVESMSHLNHLLALGRVVRERREDGAWLWQCIGAQNS